MPVSNLGPLDWRIPIVTPEGKPTQEFQRRWATQIGNNQQIGGILIGLGPPVGPSTDGAQYIDASTNPYTMYIGYSNVWNLAGTSPDNPTATAGDVAINGTSLRYMRADAAPAIRKGSASQFGIVKVDGTTIIETGGVISSVGGSGSSWKMLNQTGGVITTGVTYDFSATPVTSVDVTGLAPYTEFLIELTDVSTTISGIRQLQCSVDNGVTFFATNGDYQSVSSTGATTNVSQINFHSSTAASIRSSILYCPNPKLSIGPKYFQNWIGGVMFRFSSSASTLPINALRILSGSAGTMNSGHLRVYGK